MKKIIYIILMLCSMLTITSCNTKNEYDGKLIVATNCEFSPFEYINSSGNPTGIDMDIAKEIAKILNYELEIKDMSFNSVITAIETKQANIAMAGLTISETREQSVDFCDPYFEANQVVIGLKEKADSYPSQLSGGQQQRIAIIRSLILNPQVILFD